METFERKAYEKLASWKDSSQGSTALLIEGARRVGKSTIAEEFGRRNYASYMLVDFSKAPDDVLDAKGALLHLLTKSKLRYIRDEAVSPADRTRQGPGYNLHLSNFVRAFWNAERARESSPSLARG